MKIIGQKPFSKGGDSRQLSLEGLTLNKKETAPAETEADR